MKQLLWVLSVGMVMSTGVSSAQETQKLGDIVSQVQMRYGPYAVAVKDNFAFATDGSKIRVYDLSNPADPKEITVIEDKFANPEFRSLFVDGNFLYAGSVPISGQDHGVFIFDITNPEKPSSLGKWDDGKTVAHGLFVSGGKAFVSGSDGSHGRLVIVDVSDPKNPKTLGTYQSSSNKGYSKPWNSGNYVYVSDADGYLRILDVSNPSSIKEVGSYKYPGKSGHEPQGKQVVVMGNTLYMADWGAGFISIDISDPTNPKPLDVITHEEVEDGTDVYAVAIDGNTAYVANGWGGLVWVDISDKSDIKVSHQINPKYTTYLDIALMGDYAVCSDKGGFTNKPGLDIVKVK